MTMAAITSAASTEQPGIPRGGLKWHPTELNGLPGPVLGASPDLPQFIFKWRRESAEDSEQHGY